MRIPHSVRSDLRSLLWARADELGWSEMSLLDKTQLYDVWAKDPKVGGVLSNYLDQREVRVYIKDTILKGYDRARMADESLPLRLLGLGGSDIKIVRIFERPHGRLFEGGALIAWGKAADWKMVLMALFERSYKIDRSFAFGAVFLSSVGKFHEAANRSMVERAASKLEIQRIIWTE